MTTIPARPSPPTPDLFARLDATGIGYAGIDGAWWLPANQPFRLSHIARARLQQAAGAIFALFDAVAALYGSDAGAAGGLDALLEHKTPPALRLWSRAPVLGVRPDFQIVGAPGTGGELFVATELEICPSAQGFAHAMQQSAGLPTDLAASMAQILDGRTLLVAATQQWSEFLFDQAAFCQALAEHGAAGRVLLDLPLAELDDQVRAGARWRPPLFGIEREPPGWNPVVIERLERSGLLPFVDASEMWPERLDGALVFRFGYLDCFAPERRQRLAAWEAQGTPFLNPCAFAWDSKSVLAAARLTVVRACLADRHGAVTLDALDGVLPETRLLTPEAARALAGERAGWVLKFAGFDGGNQAWGGRSLQVGAHMDDRGWRAALQHALGLPFPVVAQRIVPSARLDAEYSMRTGEIGRMEQGTSRLRAFCVRSTVGEATVCGAHITLSSSVRVSEAADAVQGPVSFESAADPR